MGLRERYLAHVERACEQLHESWEEVEKALDFAAAEKTYQEVEKVQGLLDEAQTELAQLADKWEEPSDASDNE